MPRLKPLKKDLEHLLSLMTVQARKMPEYEVMMKEFDSQVKAFAEFIWKATLQMAEIEDCNGSDLDENNTKVLLLRVRGFVTNGEHHLNGAKGAKTRFSGVLNIKP